VLRYLLDGGHEVLVFHRGQAETSSLPSTIRHIIGDRNALPSFAAAFRQFSPQALDVMPYSEQDAITVIETLRGITERVVALMGGAPFCSARSSTVGAGREDMSVTWLGR
jgi:hypothetical protein